MNRDECMQESFIYVPAAGVMAAAGAAPVQDFAVPPRGPGAKAPVYELRQYQVQYQIQYQIQYQLLFRLQWGWRVGRQASKPAGLLLRCGRGGVGGGGGRELESRRDAGREERSARPAVHVERSQRFPALDLTVPARHCLSPLTRAQLKPGYDGVPRLLEAFERGIPHKVAADPAGQLVFFGHSEAGGGSCLSSPAALLLPPQVCSSSSSGGGTNSNSCCAWPRLRL